MLQRAILSKVGTQNFLGLQNKDLSKSSITLVRIIRCSIDKNLYPNLMSICPSFLPIKFPNSNFSRPGTFELQANQTIFDLKMAVFCT